MEILPYALWYHGRMRAIVRKDGTYVHTADIIKDLDLIISALEESDSPPNVSESFKEYRNTLAAAFLDPQRR